MFLEFAELQKSIIQLSAAISADEVKQSNSFATNKAPVNGSLSGITKTLEIYQSILTVLPEAIEKMQQLIDAGGDVASFQDALKKLNDIAVGIQTTVKNANNQLAIDPVNRKKINYYQLSESAYERLYLLKKKNNHPERTRFNPYIVSPVEFEDFIKTVAAASNSDPTKQIICQCMVHAGHATMVEFRIENGEKLAIIIDAAEAINEMENIYIFNLIAHGFSVKIFQSDYRNITEDSKSIYQESDQDSLFKRIQQQVIKPMTKLMRHNANKIGIYKKRYIQMDNSSCRLFALGFMIQAGKGDYLAGTPTSNAKIKSFLKSMRIKIQNEIRGVSSNKAMLDRAVASATHAARQGFNSKEKQGKLMEFILSTLKTQTNIDDAVGDIIHDIAQMVVKASSIQDPGSRILDIEPIIIQQMDLKFLELTKLDEKILEEAITRAFRISKINLDPTLKDKYKTLALKEFEKMVMSAKARAISATVSGVNKYREQVILKKSVKYSKISTLLTGTLPDQFIKFAQSNSILKTRSNLNEKLQEKADSLKESKKGAMKYKALLSQYMTQGSGRGFGPINRLNQRLSNLREQLPGSKITADALVYAILPAATVFKMSQNTSQPPKFAPKNTQL